MPMAPSPGRFACAWCCHTSHTTMAASETSAATTPMPLARDVASANGAVIACYETSGGGFVLGVGSLTFVGSLMDDLVLQQIVTNALAEGIAKF